MKETVELGCTPVDEESEQAGARGYDHDRAKKECRAFRSQLRRAYAAVHGKELPEGLSLTVKSVPYDKFDYLDVVGTFQSSDREAFEAAFWLQDNLPLLWDDQAKSELADCESH